jgi:hypothetical protein
MTLREEDVEQKSIVNQRMDAVTSGLIGGGATSLILIIGGVVAYFSSTWESVSSPRVFFMWLTLLSALQMGQLVLSYLLVTAFAAAPSQTNSATVK